MTVQLPLDAYLFSVINPKNLWWTQRNKYLCLYRPKACWRINLATHLRVFHTSEPRCKWARSRTFWYSKYIYSHEFLYYGVSKLLTSSKGLTKVSVRMSRIKNTIESVSKAVSGTHNELVSRIARLKSHSGTSEKANRSSADANNISANLENDKQVTDARAQEDCNRGPAAKKSACASENLESMLVSSSGPCQGTSEVSASSENHLFHISYFSTNFGETYNFVADHINSYFNNSVMEKEKKKNALLQDSKSEERNKLNSSENTVISEEKVDSAAILAPKAETLGAEKTNTALPVSTKKSIANFLSYPSNSVQAFVDSYIGGLVPKLRSESKVLSPEKSKQPELEVSEKSDEDKAKEAMAAEEREKHLSLQREKASLCLVVNIDNRTRALVQALRRSTNRRVCISRVEELTYHLLEFPESRGVAIKEKVIPCLLRLRQANDESLQAAVRETLALIGYTDPVIGWGIRILTIDGGGTRGLVALQTLRKLEELTGKPVHQLFDYICGVSTGAILAFMLGLFHIPLDDCEELYHKLGSDVFKQNVIVGTVKMGWSHAFYDSDIWEKMLKEKIGSNLMIETARKSKCPKVAAVSTIVNRGTPLKAFVFRNYNHFPGIKSHYIGGCQYKLWQAIRASSAAPGYFQEYVLGSDLHQDGGLLLNNPSALAVHECKCLWPNVPLQCLISLGTGRYENEVKTNVTHTSLKAKLTNVINSATDTEEVHTMLDALLPHDTYFRFNPLMNEDIPLDESRKEKLNQLQTDGIRYLERNEEKLKKAAKILTQEKSTFQRLQDWMRLKADMYEGFPFFSKL
ncbi:PLPL8 phospholipase, partial [Grallaria varia]|nr:PLPL8 phospholipase [Grallaria varia]